MLSSLFTGLFDGQTALTIVDFLLCIGASLVLGLCIAKFYTYRSRPSQGFSVTLALLPAVVCVVIMMVNGNVGAGVAVAGTFSLVRFRSAPGTAQEICAIFVAMATGLATGMGYLAYGALFVLLLGGANMVLAATRFGQKRDVPTEKTLRITIPEDLDYTDVFDDLFATYAKDCQLMSVKTTDLGSLFKLTYHLTLNDAKREKEFIDQLRCRNGNLEIMSSVRETLVAEL